MDRATLAAYDHDAAAFAKDWHGQPAPDDLHDVVNRFFIRGGATVDIGCGSGREVVAALAETTSLLDEEVVSASSGKKIHRIVVRKDKA
jgi:hypothetical protein